MSKTLNELVNERRSIRRFDASHKFDHSAVERALELAVLSPNSSNLQLWEFHRVISPEAKEQLVTISMGQGAARTASEMVVFVSRLDKWKERANWNLDKIKSQVENPSSLTKQEKRGMDYYAKIIPLFYDNFPWPLKTLLRKAIVLFRGLAGKPMMQLTTKADQRVVTHKSTALAAQTFMLAMQNEGYATCPMEGFDEKMAKKLLNLPSKAEITMIVACGKATPEGVTNPRWRVPLNEITVKH
ncbi:Nitroreductase [Spirosomataceae bacterium TFI 002]|nr:Nitroreductase [Spirosomataceae bacterium TFI 002]